jgi:hypothetical protein
MTLSPLELLKDRREVLASATTPVNVISSPFGDDFEPLSNAVIKESAVYVLWLNAATVNQPWLKTKSARLATFSCITSRV